MSKVIGMNTSEGANPMMEIERTYTFLCNKCETWFEYAYELILHDPAKCKGIKEEKNMTTLNDTITQATARVKSDTELLQQITSIVAMGIPDDTKITLLNGIGQAIVAKPTVPKTNGVTQTPKSKSQDESINLYIKPETGNLILKGARGVGRSFMTLGLNVKTPQLSKMVATSNSLPVQVEFSESKKSISVSYTVDKLSIGEIQDVQKFLADLDKPRAEQPTKQKGSKKADVPSPQPTIDQSVQMQIFNDASTLLKNGLAKDMEEALAKAKQARGIA